MRYPAAIRLGPPASLTAPQWHAQNVRHVYPFQVLLTADETGLDRDSKAQAEQVRSVAIKRIGREIGRVEFEAMDQLDEAIRLHLAL